MIHTPRSRHRSLSRPRMIYHVVAVSKNGVIGKDGRLPWHFSADLKFFKNLTTGHTVVMGRKTFDSIGKALPNRKNIVISRRPHAPTPGAEFVTSLDAALKQAKKATLLSLAERLYTQRLWVWSTVFT